jgi:hypothetical protein
MVDDEMFDYRRRRRHPQVLWQCCPAVVAVADRVPALDMQTGYSRDGRAFS